MLRQALPMRHNGSPDLGGEDQVARSFDLRLAHLAHCNKTIHPSGRVRRALYRRLVPEMNSTSKRLSRVSEPVR